MCGVGAVDVFHNTDLPIRYNKQDSERGQNRQRKDTGKRIGKNEAVDL